MKDIEESINKLQNEFSEKLNEVNNKKSDIEIKHEETMKKVKIELAICTIIAFGITFGLIYAVYKWIFG